eukprot:scaffold1581_cov342-Prasinococcus_capsulatus_cf.AAC.18
MLLLLWRQVLLLVVRVSVRLLKAALLRQQRGQVHAAVDVAHILAAVGHVEVPRDDDLAAGPLRLDAPRGPRERLQEAHLLAQPARARRHVHCRARQVQSQPPSAANTRRSSNKIDDDDDNDDDSHPHAASRARAIEDGEVAVQREQAAALLVERALAQRLAVGRLRQALLREGGHAVEARLRALAERRRNNNERLQRRRRRRRRRRQRQCQQQQQQQRRSAAQTPRELARVARPVREARHASARAAPAACCTPRRCRSPRRGRPRRAAPRRARGGCT